MANRKQTKSTINKKSQSKTASQPKNQKEKETIKEEVVETKETTFSKNNSFLIGIVSVLVIIAVGLLIYIAVNKFNQYREGRQLMKDFETYFQSEDLSVIVYKHADCEFCKLQEPIMQQIASDYDLDYLEVDYSKLSKKDKEKVLEKLDIEGRTPTTVVVKDGKVVATQVGYMEGYRLVNFFVDAGVLAEGSTYVPEENLTFIDYEQYEKLLDSKEPTTVVFGGATCEYCKYAKPLLSNIAEAYNIPIYYVTLDYIPKENRQEIAKQLKEMGYDESTFKSKGELITPSMLVFENGKIKDHIEGSQSITTYVEFLKEQKVIVQR